MPQYKKGDENKFFPTVIAALVVAAVAIASLIYSIVKNSDDSKLGKPFENDSSIMELNPNMNLQTPQSTPSVVAPTTPPPTN